MENSTPTSVLNELAKSNKVTAVYQLIKESGPSHQRIYTVNLFVGGHGPFEGVGSSLKAARNAAASSALDKGALNLHMNPTVELNILSMKSGEQAIYKELDKVSARPEHESLFSVQKTVAQSTSSNRHQTRAGRLWRMSVTICGTTYIGEGHSKPEARGNAASFALSELKQHLVQRAKLLTMEQGKGQDVKVDDGDQAMAVVMPSSAVSKVYEIACKFKFHVKFHTVDENGPAHVKIFQVKCCVGPHETCGQGVGKKAAKNDAAEKMLIVLKDLPADSSPYLGKQRAYRINQSYQCRQKNHSEVGIDPKLDPITYLTQLMTLRKENAPVFVLKSDSGPPQKGQSNLMRYQMEASVGDFKALGSGENKKKAKTAAADNLLKSLGMNLAEMLKQNQQVDECKSSSPSANLRQAGSSLQKNQSYGSLNRAPGGSLNKSSPLVGFNFDDPELTIISSAVAKLDYVARKTGILLRYNDFLKSNGVDKYTTHLIVMTAPPVVYTSVGATIEKSRENAAQSALTGLAARGRQEVASD